MLVNVSLEAKDTTTVIMTVLVFHVRNQIQTTREGGQTNERKSGERRRSSSRMMALSTSGK